MANLTLDEARARADLLRVDRYRVELDLRGGDDPEVRTFHSEVTIAFTSRSAGSSTFLDLTAEEVLDVELNGRAVDPEVVDGRLSLTGLDQQNTLRVRSRMRYSQDGQGLHRAADPSDGRLYVYGHLFLDAAPRVFACFDQPDLKAPFEISVLAPQGWIVLGNGAATGPVDEGGTGGRWELAPTPPLATYFVTVCAGPYVSVRDDHDGVPLGVHARASLATPLHAQADQILEVTKAAFDYYHELFGIRYPFGEYHQVFVPEFNAGAMENPGCVTLRDSYIFRGAATEDQILTRSNTIVHELAHMWFGDLVTMRWWDDLWLNESFAEYMAHRTLVSITGSDAPWVDFAMSRKTWGYAAERMPSTHPVAGSEAPDAEAALQNFDGISYAKGAAVLRQLIAYIGDEAFVAGIGDYLDRHRFGNAALTDFLGAMETAAGRDLGSWADAWLRTAGRDRISARRVGPDRVRLEREVPEGFPARRPHSFDLGGWTDGARVAHAPVELGPDDAAIDLAGTATILVPNADELTWAEIVLDEATMAALPGHLAGVDQPTARAAVWVSVIDGVAAARIDPRVVVDLVEQAWPVEDEPAILSAVTAFLTGRVLTEFLTPHHVPDARARSARAAAQRLASAAPGSTQSIAAARLLAATTDDLELLGRWLSGQDLPARLEGDQDFRWSVVRHLAVAGAVDAGDIEGVLDQDRTLAGQLAALTARAALPEAADKEWAWTQLTEAQDRSNYELNALASGFWVSGAHDLLHPYVSRYHEQIPGLAERIGPDALARVAHLAYPRTIVTEDTEQQTTARLEAGGLSPAVHRAMVDRRTMLREAIASRSMSISISMA